MPEIEDSPGPSPSPWRAARDTLGVTVRDRNGRIVCILSDFAPTAANGRLVERAPELLAALEETATFLLATGLDRSHPAFAAAIREAIRKAKGE